MEIYIPNSAHLGNVDPFIRSLNLKDPDVLKLSGNSKWISIHPVVLSMIASLGNRSELKKVIIEDFEPISIHYLERMGLFKEIGYRSKIDIIEHEPAGRFIPLTWIRNSKELSRFITDMVPLLQVEPSYAEPIRFIISELVRNVLEHSSSDKGALVAAQYYKKSNRIGIGIVDDGVGIKNTITRSHIARNDLESIKLALMPGITGETRREGGTELNAGAGLFFIKSLAVASKDFFIIYTGDSMYKLLKAKQGKKEIKLNVDPMKDRHSKKVGLPYWQGTVVGIDISLDRTEELLSVLDLIRKTFVSAIKERKKERYRRPKFI